MILNMQHLHTFKNLVEIKNFTATATKLNMTQPGVSQHIKGLEDYFGFKLLKMVGKKFVLTEKGNEVYQYAIKFFKEHEALLNSLSEDHPHRGKCKLASPGGIGIGLYSKLLQIAHKKPELSIQFFYAPNKTIEKEIEEGVLDLGFMSIKPDSKSLEARKLTEEKIYLVTPKNKKIKTLDQLLNLGFINHPDGLKMLQMVFAKNFPQYFLSIDKLKITGGTNQIGRILEPVSLGHGFSVISHFAYQKFADKKNLSIFPLKYEVINDVYIVKKMHTHLPMRFEFILNEVKKEF